MMIMNHEAWYNERGVYKCYLTGKCVRILWIANIQLLTSQSNFPMQKFDSIMFLLI